ncbi:MAG: hypothetical protein ACK5KO_11120 [Arachnia sp.]
MALIGCGFLVWAGQSAEPVQDPSLTISPSSDAPTGGPRDAVYPLMPERVGQFANGEPPDSQSGIYYGPAGESFFVFHFRSPMRDSFNTGLADVADYGQWSCGYAPEDRRYVTCTRDVGTGFLAISGTRDPQGVATWAAEFLNAWTG